MEISKELLTGFPLRRHKLPTDPFFDDGNQIFSFHEKTVNSDIDFLVDSISAVHIEEFECSVKGCRETFTDPMQYNRHYDMLHRYSCETCHRNFSSNHLLSLHISESHDAFFKAQRDKGIAVFHCLIESCGRSFKAVETRRRHLVEKHKYPPDFRFNMARRPHQKYQKNKKSNNKNSSNGNVLIEAESDVTMEMEYESKKTKTKPKTQQQDSSGKATDIQMVDHAIGMCVESGEIDIGNRHSDSTGEGSNTQNKKPKPKNKNRKQKGKGHKKLPKDEKITIDFPAVEDKVTTLSNEKPKELKTAHRIDDTSSKEPSSNLPMDKDVDSVPCKQELKEAGTTSFTMNTKMVPRSVSFGRCWMTTKGLTK
ncbi:zinc finger protein 511-like [Clytia hemisphaerica]|uniref:zinc finger protein 511-like n=1 Tax=Clytia hemisphaerica TaxID=252671 RepID=UPI0034D69E51